MFSGWRLFLFLYHLMFLFIRWVLCDEQIFMFSFLYITSKLREEKESFVRCDISSGLCSAATLWTVRAAAARPALISCLYYKTCDVERFCGMHFETCCAILKLDDNKFLECCRLALLYSEARLCRRWRLKCPRARQRGSSQSWQGKTDGVLSSSRNTSKKLSLSV